MKQSTLFKAAGVLFLIYLLSGFLLIPLLVRHYVQKSLQASLTPHAAIEQVRFNPFNLRLTVRGLNLPDAEQGEWLACQELVVDLSVFSLFRWHPVLDSIELHQPFASIVRQHSEEGTDVVETSAPETKNSWEEMVRKLAEIEIPKLTIRSLEVSDGVFDFEDAISGYREKIEPINFVLEDFTTAEVADNTLAFVAKTPGGATVELSGAFSLEPRSFAADLEIYGIDLGAFSPYFEESTNFTLDQALFELSGSFTINLSDPSQLLHLRSGRLALLEVKSTEGEDARALAGLELFEVDGIDYTFPDSILQIGRIQLKDANTQLRRNQEGALNVFNLINLPEDNTETSTAPNDDAAESALSLEWAVEEFLLERYAINWQDDMDALGAVADVVIEHVRLGGLSSDFSEPVETKARYRVGDAGSVEVVGQISLDGTAVDLEWSVDSIALPLGAAYLERYTGMDMQTGLLSLAGRMRSDLSSGGYIFVGELEMSDLLIAETAQSPLHFEAKSLSVKPIHLRTQPLTLNIDQLSLVSPVGRFVKRTKPEGDVADADIPKGEKRAPESEGTLGISFELGQFTVKNGEFILVDESVQPAVEIAMRSLDAALGPVSSAEASLTEVDLSAEVNRAPLAITGSLAPLDPLAGTELKVTMNGFAMPGLTPYSGQSVGRAIQNGLFNLDAEWQISTSQLSAKNTIVLDGFELGEAIPSEGALNLPLDLALSLLRRADGSIRISLPVSGDLSDPKLSLGQLVVQAFVGLIVKTAAAPFSLLSGLVESEKDLSFVEFESNSSQLSSDAIDSLNLLTTALAERPNLKLGLSAQVSESDREAMTREILREQVGGTSQALTDDQYRSGIYDAYRRQLASAGQETSSLKSAKEFDLQAAEMALLAEITVPDETVRQLEAARLEEVKKYLLNVKQLSPDRVTESGAEASEDAEVISGVRFEIN